MNVLFLVLIVAIAVSVIGGHAIMCIAHFCRMNEMTELEQRIYAHSRCVKCFSVKKDVRGAEICSYCSRANKNLSQAFDEMDDLSADYEETL